jgi:hypothetical protein
MKKLIVFFIVAFSISFVNAQNPALYSTKTELINSGYEYSHYLNDHYIYEKWEGQGVDLILLSCAIKFDSKFCYFGLVTFKGTYMAREYEKKNLSNYSDIYYKGYNEDGDKEWLWIMEDEDFYEEILITRSVTEGMVYTYAYVSLVLSNK